jgi:hypothetical protein
MMYYIVEEINIYKFGDIIKIYVQDMPYSKITQMGDWEVFIGWSLRRVLTVQYCYEESYPHNNSMRSTNNTVMLRRELAVQ